jgi:hypothetical protein
MKKGVYSWAASEISAVANGSSPDSKRITINIEENDCGHRKGEHDCRRFKLSNVDYLVEGPDFLPSEITFEVDQNQFVNY